MADDKFLRLGNLKRFYEKIKGLFYSKTQTDELLSGKAESSHTHTAAQVSGLPASLPANGGNADTVDGKHAASFAAAGHTHDERYYTEAEVNNLLNGKAASSHTHDERYYTEAEVNNLLNGKAASSHSHPASQISGLPTSLPANGGNSDTVDGVHVVTNAALGLHRLASGTAAANTTNCPAGCWYGQHS